MQDTVMSSAEPNFVWIEHDAKSLKSFLEFEQVLSENLQPC